MSKLKHYKFSLHVRDNLLESHVFNFSLGFVLSNGIHMKANFSFYFNELYCVLFLHGASCNSSSFFFFVP